MIATTIRRLGNRPLHVRLSQVVNEAVVAIGGERLGISHLLEYPKCGGSWAKNMLQHYVGGQPHYHGRIVRPNTVVHLHRLYSPRYCRPVVMFRDPRDVYVSYYFYERALQAKGDPVAITDWLDFSPAGASKKEFARYLEVKLTEQTDPYFSYREFFESWISRPDACLVTYENFKAEPHAELSKALRFLGYDVDSERLNAAVDYNSFANVTKRKYGKARQAGEESVSKFQRKGVVGDWVNHFDVFSRELLHHHLGPMLQELRYESTADWVKSPVAELADASG